MTFAVRFAPAALEQLAVPEDYIAVASGDPATAERFVAGVVAYCEGFQTFRERGVRRDDLLPGLRVVGYRRRLSIAVRADTVAQTVSIVGVFYGGQDFEAAIGESTSPPR
ncbi:MAG TPA: type II toxin-antitoxin system RelE/ParE family toxin [Rhodanobacteraceae bacterium]|nr:type II toxin-antitoxin system RelE/ParE family toxin [Rhodanobacteraceae bacterium]